MDKKPRISSYTLLNKIGEGAFGKIYLAKKNDSTKEEFFALKIINKSLEQREIKAFKKYKSLSKKTNLVEIIESGFCEEQFYYVMPLADSLETSKDLEKTDFRWQEKSLAKEIISRIDTPSLPYFSPQEILDIITNIFDAVIELGKISLLHRDIKPENILFFNGKAHLSDFGLLELDSRTISRIGTPLYLAPSWYLNKGGNPDVYGLATTFYALITANLPDTIGRAAYRFPEKFPEEDNGNLKEQYLHWHRCILRAIAENPADRYVLVEDFKNAICSKDFESSKIYTENTVIEKTKKKNSAKAYLALLVLIIFCVFAYIFVNKINTKKILASPVSQETEIEQAPIISQEKKLVEEDLLAKEPSIAQKAPTSKEEKIDAKTQSLQDEISDVKSFENIKVNGYNQGQIKILSKEKWIQMQTVIADQEQSNRRIKNLRKNFASDEAFYTPSSSYTTPKVDTDDYSYKQYVEKKLSKIDELEK